MKPLSCTLIVIAGIAIAFLLIQQAMSRSEQAECQAWKKQSAEYAKWYSTDWQKAECRTYGIELK
jgi:hypothetical protein